MRQSVMLLQHIDTILFLLAEMDMAAAAEQDMETAERYELRTRIAGLMTEADALADWLNEHSTADDDFPDQ